MCNEENRRKQEMKSKKVFLKAVILLFAMIIPHLSGEVIGKEVNNKDNVAVRVVTSIEPLSFFVKKVGGQHVDVKVMVPPGANPHTYEPTPSQMVTLGEAGLFVKAGSGIEFELDWMKKFRDLNPRMVICNASEGFVPLSMPSHDSSHDHGHSHGHSHGHGGHADPHFWLSPKNGVLAAANVEKVLASIDPSNAAEYRKNRKALESALETLSAEISETLADMKNRAFMVFHPAWGYFADEFDLRQIAIERDGKERTPQSLSEVIREAKKRGIRVVFVSPAFSALQAETIAREIGGVTAVADPLSGDYIENLRSVANAFAESMQ